MAEKFIDRAKTFWEEIEGIKDLLNNSQNKLVITDIKSPIIQEYLLWRILNELKHGNLKQEIEKKEE